MIEDAFHIVSLWCFPITIQMSFFRGVEWALDVGMFTLCLVMKCFVAT